MNRIYNNEAILMGCIVHLLKNEKMDMAKLYLYTTLGRYTIIFFHKEIG